jgi:hypothetical protein
MHFRQNAAVHRKKIDPPAFLHERVANFPPAVIPGRSGRPFATSYQECT